MGAFLSSTAGQSAEAAGLLAAKHDVASIKGTTEKVVVGPHGDVTRRMTSFSVAILTFSCVAGGPFGIEVAVNAAGGFLTIMGLTLAALFWGIPQALMTAELGAAIPANGGPVVWVRRALGPHVAFVNGILLVINQVTDVVLYPTLVAAYMQELIPGITDGGAYAIKVGCTVVAVGANIVGIEALSNISTLLTVGIMLPFFLIPIVAAQLGKPFDWSATGVAGIPPLSGVKENLAVFVSTILWCMQGWSEIGMLAGEVDDAGIVLPRGMSMAAVLVMIAYSCPVIFGIALSPNLDDWEDGYLVTLGYNITPWLGGMLISGAVMANMSTYLTSMAAYSRTLQAVVRENIIPIPYMGQNMTQYKTPVPCILFLGLTTCVLSYNLDFEQLVVADSIFYLLANILIAIAFVRLKYVERDLDRPFLFPGGLTGAWLASASIIALGIFTMYADSEGAMVQIIAALASVVVMALLSLVWKSRCAPKSYDDMDAHELEDPDAAAPVPGEPDKVVLTRFSSKGHIVTHRTISRAGSIARNLSRGASLVMPARAGSLSRERGVGEASGTGKYQPKLPGIESERRMLSYAEGDDEDALARDIVTEDSYISPEALKKALTGSGKRK